MHQSLQRSLDARVQNDADERRAAQCPARAGSAQRQAEKLRAFAELTPDAQLDFIVAIEKKIEYETENWVSMDYFTDAMKQRREIEEMRADVDMYEDFLADTEED